MNKTKAFAYDEYSTNKGILKTYSSVFCGILIIFFKQMDNCCDSLVYMIDTYINATYSTPYHVVLILVISDPYWCISKLEKETVMIWGSLICISWLACQSFGYGKTMRTNRWLFFLWNNIQWVDFILSWTWNSF